MDFGQNNPDGRKEDVYRFFYEMENDISFFLLVIRWWMVKKNKR